MMPILVKIDDVRSGRKAKARHRRLRYTGGTCSGVNGLILRDVTNIT